MAAVRKHEGRPLAHDLRGLVHALPGRDVVGDPGDNIAVGLDPAHVDRVAVQRELAGVDKRIGEIEIEVIAVQGRREARVVSAFQYRISKAGGWLPSK